MNTLARCKPLLGTYVEVSLQADAGDDDLLALSTQAFDEVSKVHAAMSFHDPDSELSQINQQAINHPCELSPPMHAVITQAMALSELSDGLFDITTAGCLVGSGALPDVGVSADPGACWKDIEVTNGAIRFHKPLLIDVGGIAKGYAVDCAIEALGNDVVAVVNAGGDLRMTHWQGQHASIKSPSQQTILIQQPMKAAAVATSACYFLEQEGVIYPPNRQQPVVTPNSYSVFADTCMLADALTKIALLSNSRSDAKAIITSLGAQALVIDSDNVVTTL